MRLAQIPRLHFAPSVAQGIYFLLIKEKREIIRKNHGPDKDFLPAVGASCSCLITKALLTSGLAGQGWARMMAKHTTITIETDSLLVLRGRRSLRAWCPECGAEGEMIPLDDLGVISNLPPPEVQAWIQSEDLHHTMAADGAPMICRNSMLKRVHKAKIAWRSAKQ